MDKKKQKEDSLIQAAANMECAYRALMAAAKRERNQFRDAAKMVGNAAKLREAIVAIKEVNDTRPHDGKGYEINDIIEEALAIPPRNCDVGTAEEQAKRFRRFCDERVCEECLLPSIKGGACELFWAQLPYEATQEGDSNENK